MSGTLFRALQAFIHNVAGNVATVTDARRKVTTFAYDLLNWQSTRMNQARFATQFAYGTRDNLTGRPYENFLKMDFTCLSAVTLTRPQHE